MRTHALRYISSVSQGGVASFRCAQTEPTHRRSIITDCMCMPGWASQVFQMICGCVRKYRFMTELQSQGNQPQNVQRNERGLTRSSRSSPLLFAIA